MRLNLIEGPIVQSDATADLIRPITLSELHKRAGVNTIGRKQLQT